MTIACYARKSNDKLNESILNQLSIIRSYIQNHDDLKYANILEFSDDGFSGIDINRDSFQELLAKVRQREIDVIIVKDLSRLGRNYLDVCKLTESIFPFMGVRLIAVSDDYDSNNRQKNAMDLSTAFKAVLNEYYVLESSEKIHNSCVQRVRNGEYLGRISYGYFLSDEKKPVINEEQAAVVKDIFKMYTNGASLYSIVKKLNSSGVPTAFNNSIWRMTTVKHILMNPAYIGVKVSLKKKTDVKSNRRILNDTSDWYVRENAYPPIIDKDIFNQTQALMKNVKSPYKSDKTTRHIMAGKLYCANCGSLLHRHTVFTCKNHLQMGTAPCFKGGLKKDVLYAEVLEKIRQYIKPELNNYQKSFSLSDSVQLKSNITALKEKKATLFDSFFKGDISKKQLDETISVISTEINDLEESLSRLRKSVALNTKYKSERPKDTLKRLFEASELTREHMQFIQRINVFNAKEFEIIMQPDSPLAVICKNMDIYEEV